MAEGSKAEDRACSTLLHRLILRVPKATLDILGAYAEDLFGAIFGLELDCGKLWRRKSLRCLPARGPVGGERTASCAPARGPVARGPVEGERTASCVPARGPVAGERTALSRLMRRFRDSRRLEAWLKGRKRKKGRARRCFTDLFYGFRKQR